MIKVIFLGSDKRAISVLETLHKNFDLVGIISQPDKPAGRLKIPTPTPISLYAQENNIPLLCPKELDKTAVDWIKDKSPNVLITAYYGLLIPPEMLNMTPAGVIVVHPSILPRWRWASPVQATIVSGDKETGVTLMKMDEKFDHGPIVADKTGIKVENSDNQESLYIKLFEEGANLLKEDLENYVSGKIVPVVQDHSKATFASLIKKSDGFIPPKILASALQGQTLQGYDQIPIRWMRKSIKKGDVFSFEPTPEFLDRFIRAMNPWPGAWTLLRLSATEGQAKRLKILKAHVESKSLVLDLVQLEGKSPVSWVEFIRAYPEATF